jgi:hypothetical protein
MNCHPQGEVRAKLAVSLLAIKLRTSLNVIAVDTEACV